MYMASHNQKEVNIFSSVVFLKKVNLITNRNKCVVVLEMVVFISKGTKYITFVLNLR